MLLLYDLCYLLLLLRDDRLESRQGFADVDLLSYYWLLLDSTRLDIRIKSQKHDCNGGGAPSEDPKELRRSPTFEKGECKTRTSTYQK